MVNTASTFSLFNNVPMDRIIRSEESKGRMQSFFRASFEQICPFAPERVQLPLTGELGWGGRPECILKGHDLDMIGSGYLIQTVPGIRHRKNERRLKTNEQPEFDFEGLGRQGAPFSGQYAGPCGQIFPGEGGIGGIGGIGAAGGASLVGGDYAEASHTYSESELGCGSIKDKRLPHDYAMYNNGLGHLNVLACELHVDNKRICVQDTHFMDIFDEISGNTNKNTDEIFGIYTNMYDLWKASRNPMERVWKCDFFFNKHISHALPIFCITNSKISIVFRMRDIHDCYLTSDGSVPYIIDEDRPLAPNDLKLKFVSKTYYLHDRERFDMFAKPHQYLFTSCDYIVKKIKACDSHGMEGVSEEIPFNVDGALIEYLVVVQRLEHIKNKDFFNYSGRGNKDPITEISLVQRGMERMKPSSPQELRTLSMLEHHSKTPSRHIYGDSFALFPELVCVQPSGHYPSSSKDPLILRIKFQKGLGEAIVRVFLIKLELFRINANGVVDVPSLC